MKMTPCILPEVSTTKKTKNFMILESFANSEADCVKLEDHGYCSATSCASSLHNSIQIFNMYGIKAVIRNGDVYLVKV